MEPTYAVELTSKELDTLKYHLETYLELENNKTLKGVLKAVEFTISQKDIPF